jgi:hypothetical protein
MSKVEAYKCDYCREIVEVNECVGLSAQPDLFEKLKGYPLVKHCDKAEIHLCGKCYNLYAVSVAERETNRRKDEDGYRRKLEELAYGLRAQAVSNYTKGRREKTLRK